MNDYIIVMDPVNGPHLEHKSHKYIKRWWENGKWHYTYKNTGKTNVEKYKATYDQNKNMYYQDLYKARKANNEKISKYEAELDSLRTDAAKYKREDELTRKTRKLLTGWPTEAGNNYKYTVKKINKTIDKTNKVIEKNQKIDQSISKRTETAKDNAKKAMQARYQYHKENAATARTKTYNLEKGKEEVTKNAKKKISSVAKSAIAKGINKVKDYIDTKITGKYYKNQAKGYAAQAEKGNFATYKLKEAVANTNYRKNSLFGKLGGKKK